MVVAIVAAGAAPTQGRRSVTRIEEGRRVSWGVCVRCRGKKKKTLLNFYYSVIENRKSTQKLKTRSTKVTTLDKVRRANNKLKH
jgi:hypothetical protein